MENKSEAVIRVFIQSNKYKLIKKAEAYLQILYFSLEY